MTNPGRAVKIGLGALALLTATALVAPAHAAKTKPAAGAEGGIPVDEYFIDVPDMLVTLAEGGSADRLRTMHIQLTLSVKDPAHQTYVQRVMPKIIDALNVELQKTEVSDLLGPEGPAAVKAAALHGIKRVTPPKVVDAALIRGIRIH